MIAASSLSKNLSHRRFVDAGLTVLLDKQKLKIFDEDSKEVLIEGTYDSPNWIVTFVVGYDDSDFLHLENEYFRCKANAVFKNISEQSERKQKEIKGLIIEEGVQKEEGGPEDIPSTLTKRDIDKNETNETEKIPKFKIWVKLLKIQMKVK